jgi:sterol desaturase/sphingolipid hydroxylase (fatty acid hydroxylase superfamily)
LIALSVIVASLLLVAFAELCGARRRRKFPALRRRVCNIGVWIANIFLAAFFLPPQQDMRPLLELLLGSGLPAWPVPQATLSFVIGFLLLDLLHYAVHRWQHAAWFLWRFHAVHHSDPDVDVTTSVRHHPIEYLTYAAMYWVAVLVLDVPAIVVTAHALVAFAAQAVTHGNIRLPEWLERCLQPVVITLNLHLIHHSVVYEEANANFGEILSVWDRLFGTFMPASRTQVDRLVFGVKELSQAEGLKLIGMLRTPWRLGRAAASAGD